MDPDQYLHHIKVKLALSDCIQSIDIVDQRVVLSDRGYFRARLILANGDILEIAEYFVCEGDRCIPVRYRYQWMDSEQNKLIRRWDNAKHFPDLEGFPHHIHVGEENIVKTSRPLDILQLIDTIDEEIGD